MNQTVKEKGPVSVMLLELRQVSGGYGDGDVVKGVSCGGERGEVLCLVGPNGCGKTTLFRLLLGSLPLSGGEIRIDGRDTKALSPREMANLIAYIPQYHTPIFAYTALDIVMMGRASHFPAFEAPRAPDRRAALEALEKVHALELAGRSYTALSGGQRQLILIARAICQAAKVFVMDEPASNLDYANHQLLMEVISGLADCGYCVVLSTHSPEHPFAVGSKALLMKEGRAVGFGPPKQVITPESLGEVYGIEMDVVTVRDRFGREHTLCLPVKEPPSGG